MGQVQALNRDNQLSNVQIPGAGYITYTGYTWNRPAAMTLPGGGTKEFGYDPLMRISRGTEGVRS